MKGFIKQSNDPGTTMALIERYPPAFLLLTQIAQRAKRKPGKFDKLDQGEAKIGDHRRIGLSQSQYRRAKKILEELGMASFRGTNEGTVAKLETTEVYDINCSGTDDQGTSERRPSGRSSDEQTTTQRTTGPTTGPTSEKRQHKEETEENYERTDDQKDDQADSKATQKRRSSHAKTTTNEEEEGEEGRRKKKKEGSKKNGPGSGSAKKTNGTAPAPKKEKGSAKKKERTMLTQEELGSFYDLWEEWLEFKAKEKGERYKMERTERNAFLRFRDELAGGDPKAGRIILDHTTAQNYKGIYPPNDLNKKLKKPAENGSANKQASRQKRVRNFVQGPDQDRRSPGRGPGTEGDG